jgi:putative addiction module killer protein
MADLVRSAEFDKWIRDLRDHTARARIQARITRLSLGNGADVKPVGEGLSEMRIDYGPGYRVYFLRRSNTLIVLLCGGDKSSQEKDIVSAKQIAKRWKE